MTDDEGAGSGRLTRRRALQAVGAGGTIALAGCIHNDRPCNLTVSKEHSGDTVTYGGTAEFEITVCNNGDETCSGGVTVTDDLPAGTTFDSASGSGWTASQSGGTVTFEHPNNGGLAGGECLPTLTMTVEVGQPSEVGPEIANCAVIGTGSISADPAERSRGKRDCVTVPVELDGECDLGISKIYDGEGITEDTAATFQIEVCNEGDGVCADPVTVVDGLPNGVTFDSGAGSGWSVSQSGGSVVATHDNSGGLDPGECLPVLELTLNVGSMDEVGDAIRNCAALKVDDANSANDVDCVNVPVGSGGPTGECDLSISKTYDGEYVTEGTPATFQIEVCNEGDGVCAEEVTVFDGLPSGVTFDSSAGSGWSVSQSGSSVVATHDNSGGLDAGECLPVLELTVNIGSMSITGDQIRNCARLGVSDANAENNWDCVTVPVEPGDLEGKCDLSIAKTYEGDVVTEGTPATFQIEVCNEGDGRCVEPVTVFDSLPSGVSFGSASGSGWSVTQNGGSVDATHGNGAGLDPGECLPVLELTFNIGSMSDTGDQIRNCATLKVEDSNADNDQDCVSVPVDLGDPVGECDLSVTKTGPDAVVEGSDAAFEVTVCNEGDGRCDEPVTVVDGLPAGVTFDAGAGTGWSFSESGGVVTATHANGGGLAPGDCLPTMELNVQVDSIAETGDQIRNCVSIQGEDPNNENNRDCVTVPVQTAPGECDLAITKTHAGGDVVTADSTTTFDIVVCNQGDGDCDEQVTVTDDLPAGVTFDSASGTGWSVSESGGVVTATHANSSGLAPGDCLPTLSLDVTVGSIDETGDQITNCASVDGNDGNARNDRSCVTMTVTEPVDSCNGLEIEKVAATQFTYGQQEEYEIRVYNPTNGPCDAQITVTDDLPDGISYVSHSGSGWNVTVSGGVVTATHPNTGGLAAGDWLPTLTLTVDVLPANQFPGGSDAIQNCAQLIVNNAVVHESCITHVIWNV